MGHIFYYGESKLTVRISLAICHSDLQTDISSQCRSRIKKSRAVIKKLLKKRQKVYGINTGFGSLCDIQIAPKQLKILQNNLFKSHSVGTGNPLSASLVRLMLIHKLHALALGYSGVSLRLIRQIQTFLHHHLIPFVPEQGSLGASGDLAPLAHLFSPLSGQGKLWDGEAYRPARQMLAKHHINPIQLRAKEGLALINGTQFVTAHSVVLIEKLSILMKYANLIAAMSIEALHGGLSPYAKALQNLRPHPGAKKVSKQIRRFIQHSQHLRSDFPTQLQDPYSIRCIPQVHGSSLDALRHLKKIVIRELNAVTDNPIIFPDGRALSGGHFHAQPLALALDYVALAAHELGNIIDRRCYLLLSGKNGLPPYLISHPGLNTGLMIMQYTSAALVSENKSLCYPASADSIPTSKGQEDHVSMAPISARKALAISNNLQGILAIELICAAQALDFRSASFSPIVQRLHELIREQIPFVENDSDMSEWIHKARVLLEDRNLYQTCIKAR